MTSERSDAGPGLRVAHPEVLAQLEAWFLAEWPGWYGPSGHGDAAADLRAHCSRDELPVGLVAFDGGGTATSGTLLRRAGWSYVEDADMHGEMVAVYAKALGDGARME